MKDNSKIDSYFIRGISKYKNQYCKVLPDGTNYGFSHGVYLACIFTKENAQNLVNTHPQKGMLEIVHIDLVLKIFPNSNP